MPSETRSGLEWSLVESSDILVDRVGPSQKNCWRFGWPGMAFLRVPNGEKGRVVDVRVFMDRDEFKGVLVRVAQKRKNSGRTKKWQE